MAMPGNRTPTNRTNPGRRGREEREGGGVTADRIYTIKPLLVYCTIYIILAEKMVFTPLEI